MLFQRATVVFLALLALGFLSGCAPRVAPGEIHAAWVITDAKLDRAAEDVAGQRDPSWAEGGFFCFYPNGTVTLMLGGRFANGTWTREGARNELRIVTGEEILALGVRRLGRDEHVFELKDGADTIRYLTRADRHTYRPEQDIYSTRLNAWRVPARRPHTREELEGRLHGMLTYLDALFTTALARDLEVLSLDNLPTPFLFAGNGVALKRADALPAKWLALFQTRQEALEATERLGGLFRHTTFPVVQNRFERNALIFAQLTAALEVTRAKE